MSRKLITSACTLFAAAALLSCAGKPDPTKGYVLVTNKLSKTLSIIDPAAGTEIAAVPLTGLNPQEEARSVPHEVAVAPDGRTAWVPIYSDSGMGGEGTDGRSVTIVDLATRKAIDYVDLGKPLRPHTPMFGPDGLLYITTEAEDSITIVDPKTKKVVGTLPTGGSPHFMLFSRDGKRLFVIHKSQGILVIDVKTREFIKTIPVGEDIMRLALSADGRQLFTSDETQPRIAIIDTQLDKVTGWIDLPSISYGLATSPDGKWLLCALPMLGQVGVVDLAKSQVVKTIDVKRIPFLLLFRPDSQQAYVSTGASRAVGIIDVKTWAVTKYVRVGEVSDHMEWAPETK